MVSQGYGGSCMKCGLQMLFNRWFEKHLKASTTTFLPLAFSKIQLGEKLKIKRTKWSWRHINIREKETEGFQGSGELKLRLLCPAWVQCCRWWEEPLGKVVLSCGLSLTPASSAGPWPCTGWMLGGVPCTVCVFLCVDLSLSVCICLSEIHTTPRSLARGVIKAFVRTGGCLWLTQWAPAHPAKDAWGVLSLYCPWKLGSITGTPWATWAWAAVWPSHQFNWCQRLMLGLTVIWK